MIFLTVNQHFNTLLISTKHYALSTIFNLVDVSRFELLTCSVWRRCTTAVLYIRLGCHTGNDPILPVSQTSVRTSTLMTPHVGGSGEIRTHGPISKTSVFKTGAINQTLPRFLLYLYIYVLTFNDWMYLTFFVVKILYDFYDFFVCLRVNESAVLCFAILVINHIPTISYTLHYHR